MPLEFHFERVAGATLDTGRAHRRPARRAHATHVFRLGKRRHVNHALAVPTRERVTLVHLAMLVDVPGIALRAKPAPHALFHDLQLADRGANVVRRLRAQRHTGKVGRRDDDHRAFVCGLPLPHATLIDAAVPN